MEEISDKYLKEGPVSKTWIFNRAKQLSFNNKQPSETWFAKNIRQNMRFKNMISSPLNNKKSEMIVSKPILSTELDVVISLLQRLVENPENISNNETEKILNTLEKVRKRQAISEDLFQSNERMPFGLVQNEDIVPEIVPDNIDVEVQENVAMEENQLLINNIEEQEIEDNQLRIVLPDNIQMKKNKKMMKMMK